MIDKVPLLQYACDCLKNIPNVSKLDKSFPFRDRYAHTLRVCKWCERLLERIPAQRDVVLAAAALHDIGYARSPQDHAARGGEMAEAYLREQGYDEGFLLNVADLVAHHAHKHLPAHQMSNELIILQDADCLDEIGAMTALWDCLAEGALAEQSYEKAYRRIETSYSKLLGRGRKLKSEYGHALYLERFEHLRRFLDELRYELFIQEEIDESLRRQSS